MQSRSDAAIYLDILLSPALGALDKSVLYFVIQRPPLRKSSLCCAMGAFALIKTLPNGRLWTVISAGAIVIVDVSNSRL